MEKTSVGDQLPSSHDDLVTSITAIPATAGQRKLALCVFILLVAIAVANAPFSLIDLGPVHSFVPVIQTLMCGANLLTAVFLIVQYRLHPQRALLALAGGFVFNGLFALLHVLAFPSAHASDVQIGDKLNSPTWLFAFWQATFPLAVIIYALSKDRRKSANQSGRSSKVEVGVTIACVVMVTGALTWVATAGVGRQTLFWSGARLEALRWRPRINPATAPISYAISFLTNSVAGSLSCSQKKA